RPPGHAHLRSGRGPRLRAQDRRGHHRRGVAGSRRHRRLPRTSDRSRGGDGMTNVTMIAPVIAARGLRAGYGATVVVRDLDLEVRAGEVTALLGPNGAGKTTTLMTLSGDLPALGGEVRFGGVATTSRLHHRARQGLALVTEQRAVFTRLTVEENLRIGRCDRRIALELFPELEPHLKRRVGLLSGGQQQMLALARALSRSPKLLLADELSLGLAPLVVERLLTAVRDAANDGVAV